MMYFCGFRIDRKYSKIQFEIECPWRQALMKFNSNMCTAQNLVDGVIITTSLHTYVCGVLIAIKFYTPMDSS